MSSITPSLTRKSIPTTSPQSGLSSSWLMSVARGGHTSAGSCSGRVCTRDRTGRQLWPSREYPLRFLDRAYEAVDLLLLRVDVEGRPRRRRNSKSGHQRHRAVVTRAQADLVAVGDRRQVVWVDTLECERDHPRAAGW